MTSELTQRCFYLEDGHESPFDAEMLMIECAGFRGLAYLDERGKWRHGGNHAELPGQVQILK